MSDGNIALMAHLMRRAGFDAPREDLERFVIRGYEETVEDLLYPKNPDNLPDDVLLRFHVDQSERRQLGAAATYWMYRMITSRCQLEEKIALFWHGLFATGYSKLNQAVSLTNQIDMFRRQGLLSFRDLLIELSKDPAMIIWLDNNDNHNGAVNENYGRELLELFSMGIGNYTEQDVKECAHAFTGWTLGNVEYMAMRASKDSIWPYGRIAWHFEYRPDDHDDGEKTFLGETGNFNGEDIIGIIARQPATAHFICSRLFLFFASDEIDKEGEEVIGQMERSYFESEFEIRSVLRTLFNSDYFKSDRARFRRVKGPVEYVVGAIRRAGSYREPTYKANLIAAQAEFMGQGLLQPPSVEGWHEASEWINSGSLVERVNFVSGQMGDVSNPGVKSVIERLAGQNGHSMSPEEIVDCCLDLIGPIEVSDQTRTTLVEYVGLNGNIDFGDKNSRESSDQRVGRLLGMIACSREFQLA